MDKTILTVVNSTPNYSEIFKDMLAKKSNQNDVSIEKISFQKISGTLDLLALQDAILNTEKSVSSNKESKRLMTYTQKDVLKIMRYKLRHNLSASEVAKKFNVSRSTIFNWMKKNVVVD